MIEFYDNDKKRRYGEILGNTKSGETIVVKDVSGKKHQIKPTDIIKAKNE